MPIISIQILEGRPVEKVSELIASVTNTVVETLEVKEGSVRFLMTKVPKIHWGIAGTSVSDIRKDE